MGNPLLIAHTAMIVGKCAHPVTVVYLESCQLTGSVAVHVIKISGVWGEGEGGDRGEEEWKWGEEERRGGGEREPEWPTLATYSVLVGSLRVGVGVVMLPVATRRSGDPLSCPHTVISGPKPLVITSFLANNIGHTLKHNSVFKAHLRHCM